MLTLCGAQKHPTSPSQSLLERNGTTHAGVAHGAQRMGGNTHVEHLVCKAAYYNTDFSLWSYGCSTARENVQPRVARVSFSCMRPSSPPENAAG